MEPRNLKILKILEIVGKGSARSQRSLAESLHLSLGTVNGLVKELTHQGFLKRNHRNLTKAGYNLTTKGKAENNRLRIQHIKHSIRYYNKIKMMIGQRLTELSKDGEDRLVLYGTGELCEIACIILSGNNPGKIKIIDNKRAGDKICGIKIYKEAALDDGIDDEVVIMKLDTDKAIRRKLIGKGIPSSKIFNVLPQ